MNLFIYQVFVLLQFNVFVHIYKYYLFRNELIIPFGTKIF